MFDVSAGCDKFMYGSFFAYFMCLIGPKVAWGSSGLESGATGIVEGQIDDGMKALMLETLDIATFGGTKNMLRSPEVRFMFMLLPYDPKIHEWV